MGPYVAEIPAWMTEGLTALALGMAIWRGGREERVGALVVAFQVLNGQLAILHWSQGALTDLASLAVFLWLVVRGGRYWTIWAAASAALSVATDVLNAFPGMSRWSFLSAQLAWTYVLLGSLLFGSLQRRTPGEAVVAPASLLGRRRRPGRPPRPPTTPSGA